MKQCFAERLDTTDSASLMNYSGERQPIKLTLHLGRGELAFCVKCNRKGFASSVVSYFAHAMLLDHRLLSKDFIFVYTRA